MFLETRNLTGKLERKYDHKCFLVALKKNKKQKINPTLAPSVGLEAERPQFREKV